MGYQPKKSLLAILDTVKKLGGKSDIHAVHRAANIYKAVGGTGQRLTQLHSMNLLNRQVVGKEFIYSVTVEGNKLLKKPVEEQRQALLRNNQRDSMPKKCVICACTKGLVWWKKGYFCPAHLNDDTPLAYIPPRASGLGWW